LRKLDWNYFLKLKKILVSIVILLNLIHLLINHGVLNENFNPVYGLIILLIMVWLMVKSKEGEVEKFLISIVSLTFTFQIIGYFLNNFGVRDYIDLLVLKTNIPDMIIFFTLLTYIIFKAKSYQLKN